MTREEAIKLLQATRMMLLGEDNQPVSDLYDALEMAISALEQEPCETSTDEPMTMVYPTIFCDDAISLDDAKEIIARNDSTNGKIAVFTGKQVQQMLDSLPRIITSVQPSRKGHWIEYGKLWKCSECEDLSCCHENYCNNCGADMRGAE